MENKYIRSINKIHCVALFLHPNFKSLTLLQNPPFSNYFASFDIDETLIDLFPHFFDTNADQPAAKYSIMDNSVSIESTVEISTSEVCANSEDELMDPVIKNSPISKTAHSIWTELSEYKEMGITDKIDSPLTFWKNSNFKLLAKVACSAFSVTASSAEPERHNSHAGLTLTDLRNKLNAESIESLVLYKTFMKI